MTAPSPYRCGTCDFHAVKNKKIMSGKRCRTCGSSQETTIKVHTCHGVMYPQDAVWVSNDFGLTCHSTFKRGEGSE